MPVEFPSLRLPSVNLPSFAEIRARFTAFTERVASALKSIGHSRPEPARPLHTRQVETAQGPLQAPIKQLRAAVAQKDFDQTLAKLDAELKDVNAQLVQLDRAEEELKFKERLASMDHHVEPDQVKQADGLAQANLDVIKGAERDTKALAPAPLATPGDTPKLVGEPHLAPIGHVIAKWDHAEVYGLAQKFSENLARLETLQGRLDAKDPHDPKPSFTLGSGKLSGPKAEIADLQRENRAIADKLGTLVGQAFKTLPEAEQHALALGEGGEFKQEFWELLRHAAPELPAWKYEGLGSEYSDGSVPPDRSPPKKFLDQLYTTALQQLDTRVGSGDPPPLTFKGEAYEPTKLLGEGGQGKAYLYTSKSGQSLVVKTMRSTEVFDYEVKAARGEFKSHLALMGADGKPHPNLLGIKGVARTEGGLPVAILDLASGGDLKQLMTGSLPAAEKQGLISPQAATLVRLSVLQGAIQGMVHLQEQLGARHADFKPDNVFVGADGHAKVADFGLVDFKGPQPLSHDNAEGTFQYQAPEQFIPGSTVSPKADTWAIGVFAHELFLKERPFDARSPMQLGPQFEQYVKEGDAEGARGVVTKLAENYDKTQAVQGVTSLDRMLNAMLHPDPDKRPSLSAVLNSSLFDDLGRGVNDRSDAVRELVQALTANPPDPALIKAKSDALGV